LQIFIRDNTPVLNADDPRETQPTLGFQRVLQRAVLHVQSSGNKEVTGANVLVAFWRTGIAGGVFAQTAGNKPAGCGEFHFARHFQDCRGAGIGSAENEENAENQTPNRWRISPPI
jgi:ATP-dependent Clp protease ATP-binding subunit ClpA